VPGGRARRQALLRGGPNRRAGGASAAPAERANRGHADCVGWADELLSLIQQLGKPPAFD
jgi:hypothetical protein